MESSFSLPSVLLRVILFYFFFFINFFSFGPILSWSRFFFFFLFTFISFPLRILLLIFFSESSHPYLKVLSFSMYEPSPLLFIWILLYNSTLKCRIFHFSTMILFRILIIIRDGTVDHLTLTEITRVTFTRGWWWNEDVYSSRSTMMFRTEGVEDWQVGQGLTFGDVTGGGTWHPCTLIILRQLE